MSYHFVVTGMGICVGNITNHEDFIESMIAEKQTKRKRPKDALKYAIKTALKYTDDRPVLVLSAETISEEVLAEFGISEQKNCADFAGMLEKAVTLFDKNLWKNVLLISQNKEGCIAVLLSQSAERHFVQVEMEQKSISKKEEIERNAEPENSSAGKKFASIVQVFTGKKKKGIEEESSSKTVTVSKMSVMDAMMEFVKAIIEVRFAMQFDAPRENKIYLWEWKEKHELTRSIDGVKLKVKEAELVNQAVFESKRYLIPVMFDTEEEAKENLLHLQKSAQEKGLFQTMRTYVEALKVKRRENTIVFLVEDVNSLKTQTEELLAKSNRLLEEGFYWKSKTGSLYIRHNIKNPKIVFMNPPGAMFNSKAFHRFVGKLYDFIDENSKYIDENRMVTSENKTLNNYLSEVIITYIVMFLLENIGIKPDCLSGASMGEIVFHYLDVELKNKSNAEIKKLHDALRPLEVITHRILEEYDLLERRYFDHKVNLAKYYLKFSTEKVKKAIKDYDDVFIIIEGSPKDVIVCGEKKSCEKLFRQLGCIAKALDDPIYVHTPVVESEYENIRKELIAHELHLSLENRDYKIMSSYFKKYMDETSEMFAENIAAILTKPVDYTQTVETLYKEGVRVFIDISTTQLCGNWAKVTLEGKQDVQVISVYEDRDTGEYLVNLCAAMLAGNVAFDFEKMYSRIKFVKDTLFEDVEIAKLKEDIQLASKKVPTDENSNVQTEREVQTECDMQTEAMYETKISEKGVAEGKTEHGAFVGTGTDVQLASDENIQTEKVESQNDKVVHKVDESQSQANSVTQKVNIEQPQVNSNIQKTDISQLQNGNIAKKQGVVQSQNNKTAATNAVQTQIGVDKNINNSLANNNNTKGNKLETTSNTRLQTKATMQKVYQASVSLEENIQEQLNEYLKNQMSINQKAYEMYVQTENQLFAQALASFGNVSKNIVANKATVASTTPTSNKNYLWDRAQVVEMTENSMASVLGEQYKEVDKYPIRARMPLPPFLFVSRIVSIDAEFGKLRPSEIVAEYDIDEDCVFRRGDNEISYLIASEASHIGIFLLGYMGLDVMSNGTLSYRALDATQIYHSSRSYRVGDVMRTVFKVHKFVQNGSTTIIFYTYETYNGDELISICESSGGFFTKAELASNKGIVAQKKQVKKVKPKELLHFTDSKRTSYTQEQVRSFFDGNYEACFGTEIPVFLKEKYYIPFDMKMIERITNIDYNGGKYGRGMICAEKDITPDMWPFKVHFKNDPVFPGIIMVDGVTQLAFFLMAHTGMLGHYNNTNMVTMVDTYVKSKFRGQVRKENSLLRYEVHVKEAEEREDGIHFIMDAGIFNNEVQVIQIENFAFKIIGDEK